MTTIAAQVAETAEENIPTWVVGAGALAILLVLLLITLVYGKGRPHA
jgi:hypothetical protein